MALTIEQLRTPVSEDQCLETSLDVLEDFGFTARSWQSGSVHLTLLRLGCRAFAKATEYIASLTELAHFTLATGTAKTALAKNHFDYTRVAAGKTQGYILHTCSSSAGPYTISTGQLVVSDDNFGFTYRNTTGGTLNTSGTLTLTYEAEVAGADRNVAVNSITTMVTPLAGVTVINSANPWITVQGLDEQTDASLEQAAIAKWGTLNQIAMPSDGYKFLALSVEGVARVFVDDHNPRGQNTINIFLAGATGTAGGTSVTETQALVDTKKAISSDPVVFAAAEVTVTVSGTIFADPSQGYASNDAAFLDALESYVNSLDIGGWRHPDTGFGYVVLSELIAALQNLDGVERVELTSPVIDTVLSKDQVAVVALGTLSVVSS
jgi:phage-related baseplate assembly protein